MLTISGGEGFDEIHHACIHHRNLCADQCKLLCAENVNDDWHVVIRRCEGSIDAQHQHIIIPRVHISFDDALGEWA